MITERGRSELNWADRVNSAMDELRSLTIKADRKLLVPADDCLKKIHSAISKLSQEDRGQIEQEIGSELREIEKRVHLGWAEVKLEELRNIFRHDLDLSGSFNSDELLKQIRALLKKEGQDEMTWEKLINPNELIELQRQMFLFSAKSILKSLRQDSYKGLRAIKSIRFYLQQVGQPENEWSELSTPDELDKLFKETREATLLEISNKVDTIRKFVEENLHEKLVDDWSDECRGVISLLNLFEEVEIDVEKWDGWKEGEYQKYVVPVLPIYFQLTHPNSQSSK